ncbi:MAG: hypothetical protein HQ510_04305 [Candidatus Marinimicrobia bacterium]|nr:hypothetical protein [Candidatus Neomarinimicrobiota bacterium]
MIFGKAWSNRLITNFHMMKTKLVLVIIIGFFLYPNLIHSEPNHNESNGYLQYADGTMNYGLVKYVNHFPIHPYVTLNDSSIHYLITGMKFVNDDGHFEVAKMNNYDIPFAVKLVETGKIRLFTEYDISNPQYYSINDEQVKAITVNNLQNSFKQVSFESKNLKKSRHFDEIGAGLILFGAATFFYGLQKYAEEENPTISGIGGLIIFSSTIPFSIRYNYLHRAVREFQNSY